MIHMPHRFNNPSGDSYRSLLTLLAQILSTPNAELHVKSKLVAGEPVERVKMFVDGNLQKRFEYVQFHNLDRSSGRRIATDAHIHLNPIRSWTRFLTSELLEDDVEPPVDVVFSLIRGRLPLRQWMPLGTNFSTIWIGRSRAQCGNGLRRQDYRTTTSSFHCVVNLSIWGWLPAPKPDNADLQAKTDLKGNSKRFGRFPCSGPVYFRPFAAT